MREEIHCAKMIISIDFESDYDKCISRAQSL